jgi:hypothetical protein
MTPKRPREPISSANKTRLPDMIQMIRRRKNPVPTKQDLEKQIASCRRELSRMHMGNDAATESLRTFLADLENRLRNLETR